MNVELIELRVMNELAVRITSVTDPTPMMAIGFIESHLRHARTAPLDDCEAWMGVATIAARQAVLARQLKEQTA